MILTCLAPVLELSLQHVPIILFENNKMSPHYSMMLAQVGLSTTPVMVYQTVIKSVSLDQFYNGILFFDTMSVDSYFVLNELQNNTVAFCISLEVADYLTKLLPQPTVVVQASMPTTLSLIESVLVYYNR